MNGSTSLAELPDISRFAHTRARSLAVISDNRMHAWEWIVTDEGELLKTTPPTTTPRMTASGAKISRGTLRVHSSNYFFGDGDE